MSNKYKIQKMSRSNQINNYHTRIMFHRIQLLQKGQKIPIHQYLSQNGVYEYNEIIIFPARFKNTQQDNILFFIIYKDFVIPINLYEIVDYESMIYWCGFTDVNDAENQLKFAEWQLHKPTNDKNDMFITISGKRHETTGSMLTNAMVAFGIYDILPQYLIDKANINNWRIMIGKQNLDFLNSCGETQIYTNKKLAYMLMNIPIIFYSISRNRIKEEEKKFIDIRDFQNTQLLHMHGDLLYGIQHACRSPLDMFDSMLAFNKIWKVSNDIIYLPSLPRPPYYNRNEITKIDLNQKVGKNSLVRLENIFSYLTQNNQEEILRKQFPFSIYNKMDVLKQELLKRLKSSYFQNSATGCNEYMFAPGKCMIINNELYTSLPRSVEF